MAVSVTRLDGQNVGLRLLGQLSVDVLTLDLNTGVVTSAYFNAVDLENLQKFALSLFQIVPKTARAAAALGLVSRLCAVSPADSSALSLNASVVSSVATFTASVTASPASLILTIPFAMTGGIMPSSGGGAAPPGPGEDGSTLSVQRGEVLSLGDCVTTKTGVALKCDPSDANKMPCVGIVELVTDPDNALNCIIRCSGILTGLGGLSAGSIYFVGAGGALVLTPPNTSGDLVQAVGLAVTSTAFAVALSGVVTAR
jgi:hypothetical protein